MAPPRFQFRSRAGGSPAEDPAVPTPRLARLRRLRRGAAGEAAPGALRSIPQVSALLDQEAFVAIASRHGRDLVVALLRERLEETRGLARARRLEGVALEERIASLPGWLEREARGRTASTIRPVVNATGVILHTNLGRAVLSDSSVRRVTEVARAYTTLEYDLARGKRGSRSSHLERLFALLFPGRAAHVVNNNAAATLLALNTLAEGREVVVSRGELVEIGGSFRIPDILRKSGAILREVGTTNKTRLGDYERALGPKTGLLMKVHPSNYRIVGFTAEVPLQEVARLGRRRHLPVLMDQGSGNLLDLAAFGIRGEPSVQESLEAGSGVVCFSGDKILGGPQAGILVGRADLIGRMRENPLSRALRVDKLTFAALEETLVEYVRGRAAERLPVAAMIALRSEAIETRARRVIEAVEGRARDLLTLALVPGVSLLGGGSAPEEGLATALIAITSRRLSSRAIEERLRLHDPPVISRIENRRVVIDLRTVLPDQDEAVTGALADLARDDEPREGARSASPLAGDPPAPRR
jgi:L-seryl-tRNA(Ser) seleniumtransferase